MRDDEIIGLIAVLVISAVALTVYAGLIVLGVKWPSARIVRRIGFGSPFIRLAY